MTPLDRAHADMDAAPDDDAARLRFFETLAVTELFVLLEDGGSEAPRLFETDDSSFLLAFDREDRLTAFTEGPALYAALSGRAVVGMIGNQPVGLGLNLGVAPSSFLIPCEGIAWLNDMLANALEPVQAKPETLAPPTLPETMLASLDARLASAEGLASHAYLAAVTYADERRAHILAIVDATPEAEPTLARSLSEAVAFSGFDTEPLDVVFLSASDPMTLKLQAHALRFDLPKPVTPTAPKPDPNKPPKLR